MSSITVLSFPQNRKLWENKQTKQKNPTNQHPTSTFLGRTDNSVSSYCLNKSKELRELSKCFYSNQKALQNCNIKWKWSIMHFRCKRHLNEGTLKYRRQLETPTVLFRRAGDKENLPASVEILVKPWGVALFLLIIFILRRKAILWLEVRVVILSLPHRPFWGAHAAGCAVTLTTIQAYLGKAWLQWQGREIWKSSNQLLFHFCWICWLLWTSQIIDLFANLRYIQLKGRTRTIISNWEVCRVLAVCYWVPTPSPLSVALI